MRSVLQRVGWAAFVLCLGCAGGSGDIGPDDLGGTSADGSGGDARSEPVDLARRLAAGEVRAGVVTDAGALIGGPKADGRVGDVKLYNAHVAFIVEGARAASGYRYRGGNVVDADVVRAAGEAGRDHFGEVIRTWNLEILYPDEVVVVSDGRDGLAHVRVTGQTGVFWWAANNSFLSSTSYPPSGLTVIVDYTLGPEDRALKAQHTLVNAADEDVPLDFNVTISNHGDGVFPWSPRGGFGVAPGGPLPYVGVSGRDLAYAVISPDENHTSLVDYSAISILLRDPALVPAGGERVTQTWYAVTEAGPAGLDAIRRGVIGSSADTVVLEGQVATPDGAGPAWVAVWDGAEPVTMAPVADDGGFSVEVVAGEYTVQAYAAGYPPSETWAASGAAQRAPVPLTIPEVGRLTVSVDDGAGQPLDARITVTGASDLAADPVPAVVRPGGEVPWPEGVAAVALAVGGAATLQLVPGAYQVTASHGFTHELAQADVSVTAGESTNAALQLTRTVDTTGWVSADFHLHGLRSWDAHVPYARRAREAACEGLQIPVMTEHGWVGGLQLAADALGLTDRMAPITGQEVTNLLYGHFNLFPLVEDPSLPNNGALFPLDKEPIALFELMREHGPGDVVLQVNHPRGAAIGGYFDYVGLQSDGSTERPQDWTTDFDAVEAFNGQCSGEVNAAALADWTALYNHGVRRALSSGSDSHDRTRFPGYPRNWLPLDLAAVQADSGALVQAVHAHRMVVSCGPFVRFRTAGGTGVGGREVLGDGGVVLQITVSAPTWIGVDSVVLLENGEVIDVLAPAPGADPAVRLDTEVTVSPSADAWYAVQVLGSGSLAPVAFEGEPFAMTNPIEIDADGDGEWTAPGAR